MNELLSDIDIKITSMIAVQVDTYGIDQTYHTVKYMQDPHAFARVCSVLLDLGVTEWVRSMKPHGSPPDPTTFTIKHNGTEVCLERHVLGADGKLVSLRSVFHRELLQKIEKFRALGEAGKLFIVRGGSR